MPIKEKYAEPSRLLRHGEYLSPNVTAGQKVRRKGPLGLPGKEKAETKLHGVLKRFDKAKVQGTLPQALGWIRATYPEAVEYCGLRPDMKGYGFFFGIFGALGGLVAAGMNIWFWARVVVNYEFSFETALLFLVPLPFAFIALLFAVFFLAICLRIDLFLPTDLPIIFDRKHRKVYLMQMENAAGFVGFFERWPIKICEYDWDLIDAEHQADMVTTGATVYRNHSLVFSVRKSADDPSVIDQFEIGNGMTLSEGLVPCMWEHIRRFMERAGPHLPTDDEPLAAYDPPKSFLQSLATMRFIGEGYVKRWSSNPWQMTFMHLGFYLTLPMAFLVGLGNWLSYKTAYRVRWLDEVRQMIGQPTRQGKGWDLLA